MITRLPKKLAPLQFLLSVVMATALVTLQPAEANGRPPLSKQEQREALRSGSPSERIGASQALIEDWANAIPVLLGEIRRFDGADSSFLAKPADSNHFRAVTDVLRAILTRYTIKAIQSFRNNDDEGVIRPLIWAARGSDKGLRINSTIILASVVDNTNVCLVLDHLRDGEISGNGRVNLLQVVIAVSGYMYKENIQASADTIRLIEKQIDGVDMSRSRSLIDQLQSRLQSSYNRDSPLPQPVSFCRDYKYKY